MISQSTWVSSISHRPHFVSFKSFFNIQTQAGTSSPGVCLSHHNVVLKFTKVKKKILKVKMILGSHCDDDFAIPPEPSALCFIVIWSEFYIFHKFDSSLCSMGRKAEQSLGKTHDHVQVGVHHCVNLDYFYLSWKKFLRFCHSVAKLWPR